MTNEEKIEEFEKYVVNKAINLRKQTFNDINIQIKKEVLEKTRELEDELNKDLDKKIKLLLSEKNKILYEHNQNLRRDKLSNQNIFEEVKKKLEAFVNNKDYVNYLIKSIENSPYKDFEIILTKSDIKHKTKLDENFKLISYTGDFIGGYMVILNNKIFDNSFLGALKILL
ncbi:MAG: hypothetical protein FWF57_06420 [Defluviitaleaceae bacterium]|nr:hypothetical protein [Defluviitaleaceae bacterium]